MGAHESKSEGLRPDYNKAWRNIHENKADSAHHPGAF